MLVEPRSEELAEPSAIGRVTVPSSGFWPYGYDTTTDPIGNADTTVFARGSKEGDLSSWSLNGSAGAPPSADIGDVFTGHHIDNRDDVWLYTGFERAATTGQVGYYLELNQKAKTNGNGVLVPDRMTGDIRLTFPAGTHGFRTPTIQIWIDGGWETASLPLGSWFHQSSADRTFVEFKFNLTKILWTVKYEMKCGSAGYAKLFLRSSASASPQSELKDFVHGDVDIDLCANLMIEKRDESGDPLGGATFKVLPNPLEFGAYLLVTDNEAPDCDARDGYIKLCGVKTGNYLVIETTAPNGYLLPADRVKAGKATVGETLTLTFVDPVKWAPPTISKTVSAGYDESYNWSITKTVDKAYQEIRDGTSAESTYTITVTEGDQVITNVALGGQIKVNNPNAKVMRVTLSEVAACTINATDVDAGTPGLQVDLAAGTNQFAYTCTTPANPVGVTGTNKATISWSRADYPQNQVDVDWPPIKQTSLTATAPYAFTPNVQDKTVEVWDTFTNPAADPEYLGTLTWTQSGKTHEFFLDKEWTGTPGVCETYTNAASVNAAGVVVPRSVPSSPGVELASADASIEVCAEADLVVAKQVTAQFARTYEWSIDKSAVDTVGEVLAGTSVSFAYTVRAVPGGFTDVFTMSGSVTVLNPNDYKSVDLVASDWVGDEAWTCVVVDPEQTLAPGGSVTLAYSCTLAAGAVPDAQGTNTVLVTWGEGGPAQQSQFSTDYEFVMVSETNRTVTVTDDVLNDGNPAVTLGQATWTQERTPVVFTYTTTYVAPGAVGVYVIDNIARIVETGQEDPARVDFIVVAPVLPELPRTGTDVLPLLLLSVLGVGLGAGLMRVRRRIG